MAVVNLETPCQQPDGINVERPINAATWRADEEADDR